MKVSAVIFFLVGALILKAEAGGYLLQDYMKPKDVQKKWGSEKFEVEKFRKGDDKVRAKMAYDLVQSKKYVGKPVDLVFKELGNADGMFFSESIPAYLIDIRKEEKDLWQVVFLLSKDGQKVTEVKVHKRCCY